jgi:hypothetical protein
MIKKTSHKNPSEVCGKKGILISIGGCVISPATMEISMEILQKLKINLPYDPVIKLLVIYPKESIYIMEITE